MKICYRPAQSDDLDVILSFQRGKTFFPCYIGFEEPKAIRKVIKRSYMANREILEHPELFPVFIAFDEDGGRPLGYLVLATDIEETITKEQQVMIYDFYVSDDETGDEVFAGFIDLAKKAAQDRETRYVIVEVPYRNERIEGLFSRHNFFVEMNRIIKEVEHHTFENKWQKNLQVRPGLESDRMFMMLLNAQNSEFLIPKNRKADREHIQQVYFNAYSVMEIENDPLVKVLVAQDKETMRPAGFIILKMSVIDAVSQKPLAYIYDISVHREYWGKYVTQRLMREAENYLMKTKVKVLVGDIANSNPRPLKTAIKSLGFTLHSRRWVLELNVKSS